MKLSIYTFTTVLRNAVVTCLVLAVFTTFGQDESAETVEDSDTDEVVETSESETDEESTGEEVKSGEESSENSVSEETASDESEEDTSSEETSESDDTEPTIFTPSENLSENVSISFPVDI